MVDEGELQQIDGPVSCDCIELMNKDEKWLK